MLVVKNKKFVQGIMVGVASALVLVTLFLGINFYKYRNEYKILLGNTKTSKTIDKSEEEIFTKIKYLMSMIDQRSIYEPDEQEVVDGIYKGIFNSLGDDYSCYYTAEEYKKFMEVTEGNYEGIGAYISTNSNGYCYIVAPMKDSPAEEAGIKSGDIIYKVDDKIVTDKTSDDIVTMIKGKEGTKVKITVARDGKDDYLDFVVKRKKIESPTVSYEVKKDNIGYIAVTSFDNVTTNQFKEALVELQKKKVKGLVIDLRNNPGGNLDVVVDMLDMFLPKGQLIVYTEDKKGNRTETYRAKRDAIVNLPLAVLVNENSASASEIFAGAIKDYKIGKIVGKTTFGKGIVQTVLQLKDGSAIKFTIAKYFTPKGKYIHGKGIKPDVDIDLSKKEYENNKVDTQLDMAISQVKKIAK